jgi:ATP-dependent DNA ligase
MPAAWDWKASSRSARSRCRSGRNESWLKVTCRNCETLVVAGLASEGAKFDGIYFAREDDGALVYAGKVEQVSVTSRCNVSRRWQRGSFTEPNDKSKGYWRKPSLLADV